MPKKLKIYLVLFLFLFLFLPNVPARENHNQKGIEALNRGEYREAILQFKIASRQFPNNETIRRNLCTAYNNYALKLADEGKTEEAIDILKKTLELQRTPLLIKNITALCINQGYEYFQNRKYREAERFLKQALSYDKDNPDALSLLGDVCYDSQKVKEAKEYWQRCLEINPEQEGIKRRLEKISQEIEVESKLDKVSNYHFDIRYQENAVRNQEYKIRDYLEQAYREVGQDFNYFPHYKVIVLVYSTDDYQKLVNTRSLGVYDGKIRISADQVLDIKGKLKEVLRHEYTHVLVRDLAGGNCPIWLNEGLAQYEQYPGPSAELERFYKILKERGFFSLRDLEIAFSCASPELVTRAYQQSYCFVSYIIDEYGMWRIKKILEKLKEGESIEDAFRQKCYFSLEKIEENWRKKKF
ncbi:MAG: hypothetical protein B5M48_03130 [Candidatus Omnitrophica bacterium 4484_213]|nr:MAG: hypothetical protein B5M48_03130 [Candidatus Omnitrophica bacterium 4484_213]